MTRSPAASALSGALAGLAAGIVLASGLAGSPGISDTPVYRHYGEQVAAGAVPYRDFDVEYPPLALPAFVLPALLTSTPDGYHAVFVTLMVVFLAAVGGLAGLSLHLLRAPARRRRAALAALAAGLLLLGPFTLTRFDLVPAALTSAALAALLAGRSRAGAALLGLAVAAKLYPAVLVPHLLARAWRRHGRREALVQLGALSAALAAAYVPFLLVAPDGVWRSTWRQLGRPLQIESLGASVLLALHQAVALPLGWASSFGSQNLTGTLAAATATLETGLGLAALLVVWALVARGPSGDEHLVRLAAAAVVAFVAFGKVLSPQFLVWLVPLVPLVGGRRGIAASILVLAACGLTRLWFPDRYWQLVTTLGGWETWLVLARNLLLLAALAVLVVPVLSLTARARAPARSRARGPSAGRT